MFRKGKTGAETPIFECISMLAAAVGSAMTKYMHELLHQMFILGLSEALNQALIEIVKYIPPLLPVIQGIPII